MRGRSRKSSNPLTKTYDSNGPDVKIRGTAQHIADKYAQLSRDAQVAGDRIIAENYLQHAEHYYRVIAAAQAHMQQPHQSQQPHQPREDDGGRSQGQQQSDAAPERSNGAGSVMPADAPQPVVDAMPGIERAKTNGAGADRPKDAVGEDGKPASEGDETEAPARTPRRRTRSSRSRTPRPPADKPAATIDAGKAESGSDDSAKTADATETDSKATSEA